MACDSVKLFLAADFNQQSEKGRPETTALPCVRDDDGELAFIQSVRFEQARDAENLASDIPTACGAGKRAA